MEGLVVFSVSVKLILRKTFFKIIIQVTYTLCVCLYYYVVLSLVFILVLFHVVIKIIVTIIFYNKVIESG